MDYNDTLSSVIGYSNVKSNCSVAVYETPGPRIMKDFRLKSENVISYKFYICHTWITEISSKWKSEETISSNNLCIFNIKCLSLWNFFWLASLSWSLDCLNWGLNTIQNTSAIIFGTCFIILCLSCTTSVGRTKIELRCSPFSKGMSDESRLSLYSQVDPVIEKILSRGTLKNIKWSN